MAESRKKPIRLDWQGGFAEATDPHAHKVELKGNKAPVAAKSEPDASAFVGVRKAKMRREVKGRSGHPVLVLWGFEPSGVPSSALENLCSKLKGRLGCGGTCEDRTIVLQMDKPERLSTALKALGIACNPCGG